MKRKLILLFYKRFVVEVIILALIGYRIYDKVNKVKLMKFGLILF